MSETLTMQQTVNKKKKDHKWFSKPLFAQSLRSNFGLWLILSLGSAAIFVIINLVVGTKMIFTRIDMSAVQVYVQDEGMQWLQILGLLETMGFSLARIQTMSQIDMNAVFNELIYKIAGVFLPMIYVMIVSNKLLAAQVSDGSMAYILSTPTNRKKVVATQYSFLIGSLFAMYVVITLGAMISGSIGYFVAKPSGTSFGGMLLKTLLFCLGSFIAMFGLSGICFGASGWFNKANHSIAVGGGACVMAFLCCILGLFGNKVFVAVGVGVEAMNVFNYLTIYSLIDTESMTNFVKALDGQGVAISYDWIWKLAILIAIGVVFAFIGYKKFVKKDLPL